MNITEKSVPGYERVLFGEEPEIGYRGIIAIHSTVRGPAAGGTRFWHYRTQEEALEDALRLARGMTYKNALAELPLGGGKSVIFDQGDDKTQDREKIFRAHGRFVHSLKGRYTTGEDVGTSPADMEYVRQETTYVAGLHGRSGDPSPRTARGIFRAMQASAKHRWGSEALAGKTVSIQGCGHVGYYLAEEVHKAGARLVVTDVDGERVERVVSTFGAVAVTPETIYSVQADIFAPCALGGILNDQTIPQIKAEIVCGGANNQLLEPRHGELLEKRGILYAPDYAVNAGGVIGGGCIEILGWEPAATLKKIDAIYDTILGILLVAERDGVPSYQAADRLAEERIVALSTS
ncbi:MAG TPA: Glu/Leu/Phe/Val dehydrogenase [Candidatus Angelobacter sp.]|nr:Glu/Leu/Phe/Val dehydrogenase [Candidatus Angelobacter sp.]